ncbi:MULTISPECIES: peptide-methionine (S)-S-oxide reductase MsrA [Caballeronia]|jgi:peptide-methionine (S)-S-oxide reductase|uniref:Peptide methionine sulfoxide reductase MsrA n=4 Tax=Burkholderiaceae TaxID=119060 RepID=A0A656QKB3_9BURK|nr:MULTISPECIES: peptide-methionine (S)-S-oxide reductase MsrA [Caballeronia]KDR30841.1 methionine sulfoxide reductase A [Caballeronia zhejiangensis]MDR5790147.1 peptide-methionine (S)-S-oxide reductase MsrA [Caballeronia sp. LP003]
MFRTNSMTFKAVSVAVLFAGAFALQRVAHSSEEAVKIPPPVHDESATAVHTETAVFAGGCFWGVQGVFQHVRGVKEALSGYAGGAAGTAQYDRVSEGDTGHAESVRITYDPAQVSYGKLLQIFFSVAHNPTQLNYQGPDHGTQYRSAVFPTNAAQREIANAYIAQLDKAHVYGGKIVTKIEDYKGFYPAEGYHQNYLTEHPESPYIAINDLPKVANLKQMFPDAYRQDAVLVTVASK